MEIITEKMGVHKAWYDEAKAMTAEKLPAFIAKLTQQYRHDYGTICHAIAAAGLAAMHAVNRAEGCGGGITGFQAGAVQWELIRGWGVFNLPGRFVSFNDMLYPQYESNFVEISADTWQWLQQRAKELIKDCEDGASSLVLAHWKEIANGMPPFGFRVADHLD